VVGRISAGSTLTTGKARPSSSPLKNSSSAPYRGVISDSSNQPGYLGVRLRLARPKAPSGVIRQTAPPRVVLQHGGSCPVPHGTCGCSGAHRYALPEAQVMMIFFPAWQAECPGVPSPDTEQWPRTRESFGYKTSNNVTRPIKHQREGRSFSIQCDPTHQASEGRSRTNEEH
jgi:hypothetical protein